jgi:hypothetical protein
MPKQQIMQGVAANINKKFRSGVLNDVVIMGKEIHEQIIGGNALKEKYWADTLKQTVLAKRQIYVGLHGYMGCAIQELRSPRQESKPAVVRGHITVPDSTQQHARV